MNIKYISLALAACTSCFFLGKNTSVTNNTVAESREQLCPQEGATYSANKTLSDASPQIAQKQTSLLQAPIDIENLSEQPVKQSHPTDSQQELLTSDIAQQLLNNEDKETLYSALASLEELAENTNNTDALNDLVLSALEASHTPEKRALLYQHFAYSPLQDKKLAVTLAQNILEQGQDETFDEPMAAMLDVLSNLPLLDDETSERALSLATARLEHSSSEVRASAIRTFAQHSYNNYASADLSLNTITQNASDIEKIAAIENLNSLMASEQDDRLNEELQLIVDNTSNSTELRLAALEAFSNREFDRKMKENFKAALLAEGIEK